MMFTRNQKFAFTLLATALGSTLLFAVDQPASKGFNSSTIPSQNGSTPKVNTPTSPSTDSSKEQELDMKKISQAFGHFIGRHLKSPGVEFDLEEVIKGMRDGAAGKPAPMDDKEYERMMILVQKNAFEKTSKENLKSANEYIQKNEKSPGMVEVKPGKLYYQILKEGNGEVVGPHSTPQINYTGKFIDGKVFGSSEDTGGPVSIPLDQTIPGFSLGIAGMKEGEKRRLIVHPEMGYGLGGHLPPNSLLIFDIEVVKANAPETSDNDSDDDDDDDELSPIAYADDHEDDLDDDDMDHEDDEDNA